MSVALTLFTIYITILFLIGLIMLLFPGFRGFEGDVTHSTQYINATPEERKEIVIRHRWMRVDARERKRIWMIRRLNGVVLMILAGGFYTSIYLNIGVHPWAIIFGK